MELFALPLLGLVVLLSLLMHEKGEKAGHISRGSVICFGFLLLAVGAANIGAAGATNASYILGKALSSSDQADLTAIHNMIDPFLLSGFGNAVLGSILLAFGFTTDKSRK